MSQTWWDVLIIIMWVCPDRPDYVGACVLIIWGLDFVECPDYVGCPGVLIMCSVLIMRGVLIMHEYPDEIFFNGHVCRGVLITQGINVS